MNIAQKGVVMVIRAYQVAVSPLLLAITGPAGRCRFTPSCSQYAFDAVKLHGAVRGGFLAMRRLCRCHPWGDFGEDYPPAKGQFKSIFSSRRAVAGMKTCSTVAAAGHRRCHCHGS